MTFRESGIHGGLICCVEGGSIILTRFFLDLYGPEVEGVISLHSFSIFFRMVSFIVSLFLAL